MLSKLEFTKKFYFTSFWQKAASVEKLKLNKTQC